MRKRVLAAMTVAVVISAGVGAAATAAASGPDARASAFSGQDGRIVFQAFSKNTNNPALGKPNWDLYSIDPDGTNLRRLTTHPANDHQPSVSPDGKRIAFVRDYAQFDSDILVMDADGQNERRLLRNKAEDRHPVFSPGGETIAFASRRAGIFGSPDDPQIWIINASGKFPPAQLTARPGRKRFLHYSPDGSRILFVGVDYSASFSGHDAIFTISAGHTGQAGTAVGAIAPNEEIAGFSLSASGAKRVVAYRSYPLLPLGSPWDPWHIHLGQAGGACGACVRGDWGQFPGRRLTFGKRDDVYPALSPEGNRVVFVRGLDLHIVRTSFDDLGGADEPRRLIDLGTSTSNPEWGPAP